MKPVELYRMVMGSQVWTFTSADSRVIYNGDVYLPVSIGRGGIESKNELSKATLEVRLDIAQDLSRTLMRTYLEQVLGLTLFIQTSSGTETAWKGRLSSLKPNNTALVMSFESVFTSLRRPGLRARYQKTCRHALYGRGCVLDPEDFVLIGGVQSVSGVSVVVPDAAAQDYGYFLGGMLRAPDGALGYIVGHSGSQITLQRPLNSLLTAFAESGYGGSYGNYYGGLAVKLYPGCDHLRLTCKNKFGNLDNYGGFDWIPTKNPMGGSSIV